MFNFKAFLVSGVVQRLTALGFSKHHIFSVAPDYIDEDPAKLPDQIVANIVQHSRELVGDELWKLLPTHCHIGTYSFALQQVDNYHTVGDFLPALSLFYRTFIPDISPQFDTQTGYFSMTINQGVEVEPFFLLYAHSFGYLVSCWLVGKIFPLQRIETRLSRDQLPEGFEEFLGTEIHTEAEVESWSIAKADLKLPIIRSRNDVVNGLDIGALAVLSIRREVGVDYTRIVSRYIYARLIESGRLPDQNQTASHFGFSEQAFRRQLRKHETCFRNIKQQVQHQLACELLSQTDLGVEAIAERVGFIETNSFPRAFKQWTGISPSDYRLSS